MLDAGNLYAQWSGRHHNACPERRDQRVGSVVVQESK